MNRRFALVTLVLPLLLGCAGPSTLARRSEDKLAAGEARRAWELATRALDREPGNPRARAAATSAAAAITSDWQRRIHALADVDSISAAEQTLELAAFRARASRYVMVAVDPAWSAEERALRASAARIHYEHGVMELEANRPKKAYAHLLDVEHFVSGYRDASRLANRALERGTSRVAFVPLRASSGRPTLGREVAASWRGDVVERMTPPQARFTRVLPVEDVEREMTLADLGRLSRDLALRLARRAGADRVVWGSIGEAKGRNSFEIFSDLVCRRVVDRAPDGSTTVRWVDVPIEVISRVRNVSVDLEYEVMSTRGGATLARRRDPCEMSARAVWTAYLPEGEPEAYSLVSDAIRTADPDRAKRVEARWKAVVGDGTTIRQVLEARRARRSSSNERAEAIARFVAGAAFVMLEDLPSTEDLAYAALARGWRPVYDDLLRLDSVDDVDLGAGPAEAQRH